MSNRNSFEKSNSFCKEVLGGFFLTFLLSLDFKLGLLLVEFHELGEIELGLLKQLNLSDQDILEREDLATFLDDLLANSVLNAIRYN